MPPKPAAAAAASADEVESQFERLNIGAAASPLVPVAAAAAAAVTQAAAAAAASSTPVTVSAEDQRLINGCVSVMLTLIDKLQSVSCGPAVHTQATSGKKEEQSSARLFTLYLFVL